MTTTVETKSRTEGHALKAGLDDPAVRAFVVCAGALGELSPKDRDRAWLMLTGHVEYKKENGSAG